MYVSGGNSQNKSSNLTEQIAKVPVKMTPLTDVKSPRVKNKANQNAPQVGVTGVKNTPSVSNNTKNSADNAKANNGASKSIQASTLASTSTKQQSSQSKWLKTVTIVGGEATPASTRPTTVTTPSQRSTASPPNNAGRDNVVHATSVIIVCLYDRR